MLAPSLSPHQRTPHPTLHFFLYDGVLGRGEGGVGGLEDYNLKLTRRPRSLEPHRVYTSQRSRRRRIRCHRLNISRCKYREGGVIQLKLLRGGEEEALSRRIVTDLVSTRGGSVCLRNLVVHFLIQDAEQLIVRQAVLLELIWLVGSTARSQQHLIPVLNRVARM